MPGWKPGSYCLKINHVAKIISFIVTVVTNVLLICYNSVTVNHSDAKNHMMKQIISLK